MEDYDCPFFDKLNDDMDREMCCFNHPLTWKKNCALRNFHVLNTWAKWRMNVRHNDLVHRVVTDMNNLLIKNKDHDCFICTN